MKIVADVARLAGRERCVPKRREECRGRSSAYISNLYESSIWSQDMEHKTFPCEQHQAIFPTYIRIHFDYRLWSKEKFASPAPNIRGGRGGGGWKQRYKGGCRGGGTRQTKRRRGWAAHRVDRRGAPPPAGAAMNVSRAAHVAQRERERDMHMRLGERWVDSGRWPVAAPTAGARPWQCAHRPFPEVIVGHADRQKGV